MAIHRDLGRRSRQAWIVDLALVLLSALSPTASATTLPHRLPPPSPEIIESVEPDYPVSAWWSGETDVVEFEVLVDSLGNVESIRNTDGHPPFVEPTLRALRHWKFRSPMQGTRTIASVANLSFSYFPDDVVFSEEERRIIPCAPQLLVAYPFSCRPDDAFTLAQRFNDYVAVRIDKSGFVVATRFVGTAPPDSDAVRDCARRWIFRPFVAQDGPRVSQTIPVWAAVPVVRACARYGRTVIERADSVTMWVLDHSSNAWVAKLVPTPRHERAISRIGEFERPVPKRQVLGSDFIAMRAMPADSIRTLVSSILEDPKSYQGAGPLQTRRLPNPEYAVTLWAPGERVLEMAISPAADFIAVTRDQTVMYMGYQRVRPKVRALLRALFGDAAMPVKR